MPRRKESSEDERHREGAKVSSRSIANSIARPLLLMKLSSSQMIHAAAGHGRTTNSGNSSGGNCGGSGGNSGSGNTGNSANGGYSNGNSPLSNGGGGGGGGAIGGGTGGGGMNPGNNGGRGNYGPSSPPTGSLPPFYESLKGGNILANFANQFNG